VPYTPYTNTVATTTGASSPISNFIPPR